MMSPDVQRAAITEYCFARGYEVVDWLEGIDQSGSRVKSAWWPRLAQAVEQVKVGEIDVIVVWKFSRTARNRLKWAITIDGVESAGGLLESATEQIDTTTSAGRFARGMLGEMNVMQAEMIGESWKEAHAHRLSKGLSPTGLGKYGYTWDKAAKIHRVDPVQGPVLAEAYERYIAGESIYMLARWLNTDGHQTRDGGPWTDRSLRRVLDAGFGAGLIPWRGDKHPGAHEAVIDKDTWQAYLDARASRRQRPRRVERSSYLLSGLVRCARCGGAMVANNAKDGVRKPAFRCTTAKERGREACAGGYVAMDVVEEGVREWLTTVSGDVDAAAEASAAAVAAQVSTEGELRRLSRELMRIDDALTELTKQLVEKLVPASAYVAARDEYLARQELLTEQVEMRSRELRLQELNPPGAAAQLLAEWRTWPVEYRRTVLRSLIREVRVLTGTRAGVKGVQGGRSNATVTVVEAWQ